MTTGFSDLSEYVRAPRVVGLRLSPDGSWLALAVQTADGTPARYLTSIWRLDAAPGAEPVRLTRSADGEGSPEFRPDGSLVFVSKRPDGSATAGLASPHAAFAPSLDCDQRTEVRQMAGGN